MVNYFLYEFFTRGSLRASLYLSLSLTASCLTWVIHEDDFFIGIKLYNYILENNYWTYMR
jgi:hypothetical protein